MKYIKNNIKHCLCLAITLFYILPLQIASAKPALPPLIDEGENINNYPNMPKELIDATQKRRGMFLVALSPDGKLAASIAWNEILLWDLQTNLLIHSFKGHKGWEKTLSFSPDGKQLASSSLDGTINFWDLQSKKLTHSFQAHNKALSSVMYSPDGKLLVTSSHSDPTFKLWDIRSHKLIYSFKGHKKGVYSVVFSPDGTQLASSTSDDDSRSSENSTIKLWDLKSRQLIHTFEKQNPLMSVIFSQDGKQLISVHYDKPIKVWDIKTKQLVHQSKKVVNALSKITISPDRKQVVTSDIEGTIKLWDINSQQPIHHLGKENEYKPMILSMAYSPDGKQLASVAPHDESIKLWNLGSEKLVSTLEGHTNEIESVKYSADGKTLIVSDNKNNISFWDLKNKRLIHRLEQFKEKFGLISLNFDGKEFAFFSLNENTIKLWDLEKNQLIGDLAIDENDDDFTQGLLIFSPDGKLLASSFKDVIKVWDLKSHQLIHTLEGHKGQINSITISQDSKQLASAATDKTLKLWDLKNSHLIHAFSGLETEESSVAFSPDGKQLALSSIDKTVKLWDLQKKSLIHSIDNKGPVGSVVFSPDGKQLAFETSDYAVELWDLKNKKLINRFKGHGHFISSIAFSPDGSQLASSSSDHSVILWNLKTKKLQVDLVSGINGNWLWQDRQTGQFWRGDDGTFLLKKNKNKLFQSLTPIQVAKKDILVITKIPQKLTLKRGVVSKFKLELKNNGDKTIFWIKTKQAFNDPFVVYPAKHYRLDKGKTASLTISVSDNLTSELKLVNKTLEFELVTAAGSRFPISIPVTIVLSGN